MLRQLYLYTFNLENEEENEVIGYENTDMQCFDNIETGQDLMQSEEEDEKDNASDKDYEPAEKNGQHHFEKIKCRLCNSKFDNEKELTEHFKSFHEEHKLYECEFDACKNESFVTATILYKHIKECHENPNDQICNYCSKSFNCSSELKRHIRRNHFDAPKNYKCHTCDQTFLLQWDLCRHVKGRYFLYP